MIVYTTFSLLQVNQERMNSLFMQVQCAISLTVVFYYSTVESTVDRMA